MGSGRRATVRTVVTAVLVVTLTALSVKVFAPAEVGAIVNGVPDGSAHPYVGALGATFDEGPGIICTGTLVSPTVFVTAAHCTAYLQSVGIADDAVWVSFDSEITAGSVLYDGTMHTNPRFNQRQSDPGDIAVVVLDEPVTGFTPATLPTYRELDAMARARQLRGQRFLAVGYGASDRTIGAGPPRFFYDTVRRRAEQGFDAINNVWLRLSENPATGDGGGCFGDSGGPNLLSGTDEVVALTITGDSVCRATNVVYRLDTRSARDFLGDYVTLP